MKPNWKDATEWADWVVMDAAGDWIWHECEPLDGIDVDHTWTSSGRKKYSGTHQWVTTKEKRPR